MSNVFSRFENGVESAVDAAAGTVFKSPIEPAQVAKKAEKQMKRNRLVGAGRQYAPTLYNVLVSAADDKRLFGFYPTMAAEIETYLMSKGTEAGLDFDGRPLVRFIVDEGLKKGKFDVISDNVSAAIIRKLREEEMAYYGLAPKPQSVATPGAFQAASPAAAAVAPVAPAASRAASPAASAPAAASATPSASRSAYPSASSAASPSLPQIIPPIMPGNAEAIAPIVEVEIDSVETDTARPSMGNSSLVDLKDNTRYFLGLRNMTIGRNQGNDIVLNDVNASRTHAQLNQDATGTWKLSDLNSTNGVLLNDRPVHQALLADGDRIIIGLTTLEFNA